MSPYYNTWFCSEFLSAIRRLRLKNTGPYDSTVCPLKGAGLGWVICTEFTSILDARQPKCVVALFPLKSTIDSPALTYGLGRLAGGIIPFIRKYSTICP